MEAKESVTHSLHSFDFSQVEHMVKTCVQELETVFPQNTQMTIEMYEKMPIEDLAVEEKVIEQKEEVIQKFQEEIKRIESVFENLKIMIGQWSDSLKQIGEARENIFNNKLVKLGLVKREKK